MGVRGVAHPGRDRVHGRAAPGRVLGRFEHHHAGALAEQEAVPAPVEKAGDPATSAKETIPLRDFFKNPEQGRFDLSPDDYGITGNGWPDAPPNGWPAPDSFVRLKGVGVSDADLLDRGVLLINMQMIGMLLGGILWGILGDKREMRTLSAIQENCNYLAATEFLPELLSIY